MSWSFILGTWRPIVCFNRCESLQELYLQALSRVQQYHVADYRYSAAQRIYRSNPSFLVDLSCLLVTSLAFSSSTSTPDKNYPRFHDIDKGDPNFSFMHGNGTHFWITYVDFLYSAVLDLQVVKSCCICLSGLVCHLYFVICSVIF